MTPERKTIFVSSSTAILLSVSKLIVGILTWSMTIIASAVDSVLDFFVSIANYFVLKKSEQGKDWVYNFWYGKIQWLGALFEWTVIVVSWCSIIYLAIKKIISNEIMLENSRSIYVMVFSIFATWMLVIFMSKMFKKTNNLVIKSDLLHYKSDLYANIGIIVALIIIKFTGFFLIDPIISILIALYIIYGSIGIITEGYVMLLDRSLESHEITLIKDIIQHNDKKISGFHALRTRRSGKDVFIEFHLVFDKNINLLDAHSISNDIDRRLQLTIPYSEVLIHLDPYDDLSEELMKKS